jgi:hypothetical protein
MDGNEGEGSVQPEDEGLRFGLRGGAGGEGEGSHRGGLEPRGGEAGQDGLLRLVDRQRPRAEAGEMPARLVASRLQADRGGVLQEVVFATDLDHGH